MKAIAVSRLLEVRSAFVSQGSSLHRWCRENQVDWAYACNALSGKAQGPAAVRLKARILQASGVRMDRDSEMANGMNQEAASGVDSIDQRLLPSGDSLALDKALQLHPARPPLQGNAGSQQTSEDIEHPASPCGGYAETALPPHTLQRDLETYLASAASAAKAAVAASAKPSIARRLLWSFRRVIPAPVFERVLRTEKFPFDKPSTFELYEHLNPDAAFKAAEHLPPELLKELRAIIDKATTEGWSVERLRARVESACRVADSRRSTVCL